MKKINILKNNRDFSKILKNGKQIKGKLINIYYIYSKKEEKNYKIGISVKKKIGNAVVRNKIKRQIRNIVSKNKYENLLEVVIIAKEGIQYVSFQTIERGLNLLLLSLYKKEKNE